MSHIYALTCVNVLDRIADSRPLLRLEAQSRRESLRTNENGCPWGTDGFRLRFPVFGGIGLPGKGSVRKYDAHQGVPAEMAYIRSWIAQANGIDRGGTTNSYLTRGSVNNEFAIFRSPEST